MALKKTLELRSKSPGLSSRGTVKNRRPLQGEEYLQSIQLPTELSRNKD